MRASNNPYIPFAVPDIGEEEIKAVTTCLRSGWITTGPLSKQFEEDFRTYICPEKYAVAVNSATMGLILALEALGVGAGDEVLVPAYTFSASAMPIHHLGARPVFVDVDPDTLNLTAERIEQALTPKTKALVLVHMTGLACDLGPIITLCQERNIRLIEDAAHALHTTYQGKLIGSHDVDATVFSFYPTKHMTTGEGGLLLTKHQQVADRAKVMRLHGISTDAFDRYTAQKADWHYDIAAPGYKCNMTDLAAAIGIEQLKKAARFLEIRDKIASYYLDHLSHLPLKVPKRPSQGDQHSWHLFILGLPEDRVSERDALVHHLKHEKKIGFNVHYKPLHLHTFWQKLLGHKPEDFPNALKAYQRNISVPLHTKMSDQDIHRIITALQEIF